MKTKRGRSFTTGRFSTRTELIERVWWMYDTTDISQADIARNVRVSEAVVGKILKRRPVWIENWRTR